jgi:RecA/RadA recombinase
VEPELVRMLERNEGVDPRSWAAALPDALGGPGLLIALTRMGALRLARGEARTTNDTPFSGAAIFRAQARALDATYFEILGVPLDVRGAELAPAHALRLAELGAPRALLEQDPRLAAALRDALAALDEALRVLSVDSLRARYRAALAE